MPQFTMEVKVFREKTTKFKYILLSRHLCIFISINNVIKKAFCV